MNTQRAIFGLARADFRERTRRYSFFLTLLFAVFLGYSAATGKIFLQFDETRGVYTSGWIGTLITLTISCFVSLAGFYIVKNSVDRDRTTGVGQILAATALSKNEYALGKFLSNVAVLSSMVGVLAVAAVIMQVVVHEDPHFDLWALLSPFLLIALPVMALTAAFAVLFEMVPLLSGGFGNVIWFFVWNSSIATPILASKHWLDPMGLATVMDSLGGEAHRFVPGYRGGMSFQIDIGQPIQVIPNWRWSGIPWDGPSVLLRVVWVVVACGLVLFAAACFDRFDTLKKRRARGVEAPNAISPQVPTTRTGSANALTHFVSTLPRQLTPLPRAGRSNAFFRLLVAELRLALFGLRWWWYAVAFGLLIAQFFTPLEISRGPILASSWMWCVFVWSSMGARETRFATRPLLFSCAKILPRQVFACFLAGLTVALLTGTGTFVRLAAAGRASGLLAWFAGALLLPSLALFLGVSSGLSKPFEAAFTFIWYVGPMSHTPGLDFTGVANASHTTSVAALYLSLTAVLLVSAFAVRARQLRSV